MFRSFFNFWSAKAEFVIKWTVVNIPADIWLVWLRQFLHNEAVSYA